MDKEVHEALNGKYNGIFRACANSVYQASPWGGEGPGDEAKCVCAYPGAMETRSQRRCVTFEEDKVRIIVGKSTCTVGTA